MPLARLLSVLLMAVVAAHAVDTGDGLRAEYFLGSDPATTPVLSQIEAGINQNWGRGGPPGLPVDGFSARWMGQVEIPASGTWTFTTRTDDGVRLRLGGRLLIDRWVSQVGENSASVTLSGGTRVDLEVEYFEGGGDAFAQLFWSGPGTPRSLVPRERLYSTGNTSLGSGSGLTGAYRRTLSFASPPDLVRTDPRVQFTWASGAPAVGFPADAFCVRWTGTLEPRYDGPIDLTVRTDDGVRLWVDNRLVVDDWRESSGAGGSVRLNLERGRRYGLRMDYFERAGSAQAALRWAGPDEPARAVPTSQLHPLADFHATVPHRSRISPAFVEGMAAPGVTVTATAAAPVAVRSMGATGFWLDVPLSATLPLHLRLSGGGRTQADAIVWEPTVFDGGETVLRRGDSLLLAAPPGGRIAIERNSGVVADLAVPADGRVPYAFTESGYYRLLARGPSGEPAGAIDVRALAIDYRNGAACEVGFSRELVIPVAPDGNRVVFVAGDAEQLTVVPASYDAVAAKWHLQVKPTRRGTPVLLARIGDAAGPILWSREIDEFTIDSSASLHADVFANTNDGLSALVMRPYVADVFFTATMFGGKATWRGGDTVLRVNTSDTDPATGDPLFVQSVDPATGDTIGTCPLRMVVRGDVYCFTLDGSQITNPEVGITIRKWFNGETCRVLAGSGVFIVQEFDDERPDNLGPADANGRRSQLKQRWIPKNREHPVMEKGTLGSYKLIVLNRPCPPADTDVIAQLPTLIGSAPSACAVAQDPVGHCRADHLIRYAGDCTSFWPGLFSCEPCDNECKGLPLHTGVQHGTASLAMVACNLTDIGISPDFFHILRIEADGFTGAADRSSKDEVPDVCVSWPDTSRIPAGNKRTISGMPVHITLRGQTERKARVLSRFPDRLRVSKAPTVEVGPNQTPAQVFTEDCVEVTWQQREDCFRGSVVYLYGISATPAGSPAMIEVQGQELRLRCKADGTGFEQVDEWVIADTEVLAVVPPSANVRKVTFNATVPARFFPVSEDRGVAYGTPHWFDRNDNASASEVGEHRFPLAYQRGATVRVSEAEFRISETPANPATVQLRARGTKGYDIVATPGVFAAAGGGATGGTVTVRNADASKALAGTIDFLNLYELHWEMSLDDGVSWCPAGTSDNRMYVTLEAPLSKVLFESLLDIGCRNAAGQAAGQAALDKIWTDFEVPMPGIRRKPLDGFNRPDNQALGFWRPVLNSCQNLPEMLRDVGGPGNGTCVAFAQLLHETLDALGIAGSQILEITPDRLLNPGATGFLIKDWKYAPHIAMGPNGVNESLRAGDDVEVFAPGQGLAVIDAGPNGALETTPRSDDVVIGTRIHCGPNGIADSSVPDDRQIIPPGNGRPGAVCIRPGPNGVRDSIRGGDDVLVGADVTAGPNGINESLRLADDVEVFPQTRGQPNQLCIAVGVNGVLDTVVSGDDAPVAGGLGTGPNGVCESSVMVSDDVQVTAPGSRCEDLVCITAGADGVLQSTRGGDDVQRDGIYALRGYRFPFVEITFRNGAPLDDGTVSGVPFGDLIPLAGVAGQDNANPPDRFNNHFVVRFGTKVYDPSYGRGPFAAPINHEDAVCDGIEGRIIAHDGTRIFGAKKNDPPQELLYRRAAGAE